MRLNKFGGKTKKRFGGFNIKEFLKKLNIIQWIIDKISFFCKMCQRK
jgi:hypothetical protein